MQARRPARLILPLPLLLALALGGCKPKAPAEPEPGPPASYGDRAYGDSPAIRPLEICEHLGRMVAAEAGTPDVPMDPQMMAECERDMTIEANQRGTDNWNAIASCVLQSRTEADIDYCDRTYPMPGDPGPAGPGPAVRSDDYPREREACNHMIEIFMLESAAETGEVPQLSAADKREVTDECVARLVHEHESQLEPRVYAGMLDCFLDAQTGAQLSACEELSRP